MSAPIPVRLSPEIIARLDVAAQRMGTNRAALIRFCTETFLSHFEQSGGVASLPMNWKELLRAQDARTSLHARKLMLHNVQIATGNAVIHNGQHHVSKSKKKRKSKIG